MCSLRLFLFLLFCAFAPNLARAQTPAATSPPPGLTIHVVTREVAPFVMKNDGQLTGFFVELWNAIARQMNVRTQWDVQPNVKGLLQKVQSGRDQAGIAAISISSKRERGVDFSQPMFDFALLSLRKNGTYNALSTKYFGDNTSG